MLFEVLCPKLHLCHLALVFLHNVEVVRTPSSDFFNLFFTLLHLIHKSAHCVSDLVHRNAYHVSALVHKNAFYCVPRS